MSQRLDNAVGWQGWRVRQPPKTIRAETEPDYKQGPSGKGPTTAWLSSTACREKQQGSAGLGGVDIDRTGGSRESG